MRISEDRTDSSRWHGGSRVLLGVAGTSVLVGDILMGVANNATVVGGCGPDVPKFIVHLPVFNLAFVAVVGVGSLLLLVSMWTTRPSLGWCGVGISGLGLLR